VSEWEPLEDEEAVEEAEELVGDDSELVEDEEVEVAGEAVVARPAGDPVLEYVYGFEKTPPASLGEWRIVWMVSEYYKAVRMGDKRRAGRWVRLIFRFCPYKPRMCPLYSLSRCPFGLERRCRPLAWAEVRRRRRKWRRSR